MELIPSPKSMINISVVTLQGDTNRSNKIWPIPSVDGVRRDGGGKFLSVDARHKDCASLRKHAINEAGTR